MCRLVALLFRDSLRAPDANFSRGIPVAIPVKPFTVVAMLGHPTVRFHHAQACPLFSAGGYADVGRAELEGHGTCLYALSYCSSFISMVLLPHSVTL